MTPCLTDRTPEDSVNTWEALGTRKRGSVEMGLNAPERGRGDQTLRSVSLN